MPPIVTYTETQEDFGLQLMSAIDVHVSPFRRTTHVLERMIGMLLFGIATPLIGILVICVRMTSSGPGLYRQVRVGRHGRIFTMLKIRTMTADAEILTGPQWTRVNDPRITTIGIFLRKTHLDELPQLWNVACGDMAIMGPRPERPELVHVLAEYVPGYLNRLAVQPGITGLAQINLPPDSDVESVRRKLILDLDYIRNANLWLDLRMFVWTIIRLAGCPASIATPLLGLRRKVRWSPPDTSGQPLTIDAILAMEQQRQPQRSPASDFPSMCEAQRHSEDGVSTDGVSTVWQRTAARA